MNKELFDIIEEVEGLEDALKWIKAVMHLDKRIEGIENVIGKIIGNQGKLTNILENLAIGLKRGE